MIPGRTYTPQDILAIARRRIWLVAACAAVAGLAAFGGSRLLPDRYRSETLILLVPQRVPDSYVRSTVTMRIEDRLASISQQILSRTRLEQIINDFNLYAAERAQGALEDVVVRMRRDIEVEVVKGDAFRVTYTGADPHTVMKVTERLASLFIDENLRDRTVMAEDSYRFLDAQLDQARTRLVEHEKTLEAYRRKYSGQLPEQLDSNLRVIQNAQLQLQSLNEAKARAMDRRLIVERTIADLIAPGAPETVVTATAAQASAATAAQQLDEATEALRQLEVRLTPEHPDLIRARRVVATLARQADEERLHPEAPPDIPARPGAVEMAKQNRLREARAELQNIDREEQRRELDERRLRDEIADYQARVESVPTRESELVSLTRDYDTLQKTYVSLLFKQQDSKLAADLERRQIAEHFNVLDPAQLPERPSSPNRSRLVAMGVVAGLALGIAIAFLLEVGDSTLKTETDVVSALGLKVLALVPALPAASRRGPSRSRMALLALTAWSLLRHVGE